MSTFTFFSLAQAVGLAVSVAPLLFVPGPTNTLLLASGLKVGFRKSLKLTLAELLGYLLAIPAWGAIVYHFSSQNGPVISVIRVCCGLYLAWVAWKLWHDRELVSAGSVQVVTFRRLFLATLMNPKAFLFAVSLFPSSAFFAIDDLISSLSVFSLVLVPAGLFWISLGSVFYRSAQGGFAKGRAQKAASLVLFTFASLMIMSPFTANAHH